MAPPSYYEQLATDLQRFGGGKPTNAQALALVDAYGTLPMSDADLTNAFETVMRLRWRAHGYVNPGDKFAVPSNAAFYARPYADPQDLVGTLKYVASSADHYTRQLLAADEVDGPQPPQIIVVDRATAAGDAGAISQELAESWEALRNLRATGVEPTPPATPKPKPKPRKPSKPVRPVVPYDEDPSLQAYTRDLDTIPPGTPGHIPTAAEVVAADPDGSLAAERMPGAGDIVDVIREGERGAREGGRKLADEVERLRRKSRARTAQAKSMVALLAIILVVAAWRRR